LRSKGIEHSLQGAGRYEVVVSKYPNILACGLFKTLKDIEACPEVGFIVQIAYIEPLLSVILDHSLRIVRGSVVRHDKLDTVLATKL
jgi:hypothetical protein